MEVATPEVCVSWIRPPGTEAAESPDSSCCLDASVLSALSCLLARPDCPDARAPTPTKAVVTRATKNIDMGREAMPFLLQEVPEIISC